MVSDLQESMALEHHKLKCLICYLGRSTPKRNVKKDIGLLSTQLSFIEPILTATPFLNRHQPPFLLTQRKVYCL